MRTYERLVLLGAGIAAVAVFGAWYATTTDGTEAPSLEDAVAACVSSGTTSAAQVRDDGHTLIMSAGLGDEPTFTEVACVLGTLDAPASVTASMERTRALDGVQTAAWGSFTASWTFHPENGLDLILEGS